ncbi:MAG TPA: enoyl-CoA hydratase/isomerase family protein [Burkholderiales bacterium]|nr:enoyl-CoA hydratase/isomerase family protein [Burkholderiales bacterium]
MAYRFIDFRRERHVAHLTFRRPDRRNALNHDMMREIGDAVERVAADRGARALVLRGAGGAFCAGGDLGAMSDMPPAPRKGPDPLVAPYRYFGEVLERLNRLPQAVIAVVEGPAVGGGLGMVCCSDVVILHTSAKLGIPEPRSGFIASQILPFLVRRVGESAARYLAVTGTVVGAKAALEMGLAQIVSSSLNKKLDEILRQVGRMEPDALATVKRLVLDCAIQDDRAVMDAASVQLVRLLRRPEARAGMEAFLQKKPPPWAAD